METLACLLYTSQWLGADDTAVHKRQAVRVPAQVFPSDDAVSNSCLLYTSVCASVFLSFFVLLFAAFLSGASPFGLPVLSILPFVQGMGTGCVSAYLVLQTGMQGIWTELLIFFVPDALMSLLLIGYISKAADTSVKLFLIHVVQRKNTCARLDDLIRLFLQASSAALGLSLLAGGLNHLFSDLLSSLPASSFPSV